MNILKKIFSNSKSEENVNRECTSQSSTVSRKDIISQTGNEVVIASQTPYGIDVSDEVTPGTLGKTIAALRQKIVDMVGPQFFEVKMEMFDEELAAAYREIDYLQMKQSLRIWSHIKKVYNEGNLLDEEYENWKSLYPDFIDDDKCYGYTEEPEIETRIEEVSSMIESVPEDEKAAKRPRKTHM